MKKFILFIIFIPLLILVGCEKSISNLSQEDAILELFGKFEGNSKSGVKGDLYLNSDDEIVINYVAYTESIHKLVDANWDDLTEEEEEKLITNAENDISKLIMNKLEILYTNKNIDKIHISILIEESNNHLEDTFEFYFNRDIYNSIDWKKVNREKYLHNMPLKYNGSK